MMKAPGSISWAVLAFSGLAAGAVYAQSAEPAVDPAAAAEAEGESAEENELNFPDLLPGYYSQTMTVRNMTINMPTKWSGGIGRRFTLPARTEQLCYTGEELQRASEFLPGNVGGSDDCRIVSSVLEGTHGRGEMVCTNRYMRMNIRYSGEFTDTTANVTLIAEMSSKSRDGSATIKLDVAMQRIAETCTEDIEDNTGSAEIDAAIAVEAAKKM